MIIMFVEESVAINVPSGLGTKRDEAINLSQHLRWTKKCGSLMHEELFTGTGLSHLRFLESPIPNIEWPGISCYSFNYSFLIVSCINE